MNVSVEYGKEVQAVGLREGKDRFLTSIAGHQFVGLQPLEVPRYNTKVPLHGGQGKSEERQIIPDW